MKCSTMKDAYYVCISQNCPHMNAYLCADSKDSCKVDHQSCALINWTFVLKKFNTLTAGSKNPKKQLLKPLQEQLLNTLKQVQLLMGQNEQILQMKKIINNQHLSSQDKTKIGRFIHSNTSTVVQLNENKLYIQLEILKTKIINYQESNYKKGYMDIGKSKVNKEEHNKIIKEQSNIQEIQKFGLISELKQSRHRSPSKNQPMYVKSKLNQNPSKSKVKNPYDKGFQQKISYIKSRHIPKGPLFSKITNDIQQIYDLFPLKFAKAALLYRASQNQFSVNKFHEKCNDKTHTLTLIMTEYQKVIGGYTPLPWKSTGGEWFQDKNYQSFLFSLTTGQKFPLKTKQKAIWCSNAYGPSFGHPDLQISDRAIHNTNSCANFPMHYSNGDYVLGSQSNKIFCGSVTGHFRIIQWEVYQLEFIQ